MAWLDRGEVTGDLPNTGDGKYYNESIVNGDLYPGVGGVDWGVGIAEWVITAPVPSTGDIENYVAEKYDGTGSIHLSGTKSGPPIFFACYVAKSKSLLSMDNFTHVLFYAKSLSSDLSLMLQLTTNVGTIQTDGATYPHPLITSTWQQYQLYFDTDFLNYTAFFASVADIRFIITADGAYDFLLDEIQFY